MQAWYKRHLGIDVQDWGGAAFRWTDADDKPVDGTTIWSIGSNEGDSFAPSTAPFMVNYRVADIRALLEALREEGWTYWTSSTTRSTGSSGGSSIQKATRSSYGNRPPDSRNRLISSRGQVLTCAPAIVRPGTQHPWQASEMSAHPGGCAQLQASRPRFLARPVRPLGRPPKAELLPSASCSRRDQELILAGSVGTSASTVPFACSFDSPMRSPRSASRSEEPATAHRFRCRCP